MTGLQVKSKDQKPVDSILAKLRMEMRKLNDVRVSTGPDFDEHVDVYG